MDELVTRVKKQTERAFMWTTMSTKSKLIVVLWIGWRTIEDACLVVHQVMSTKYRTTF